MDSDQQDVEAKENLQKEFQGEHRHESEEDSQDQLREGVGLALSGGGFRAMLFHLGVLWRLTEMGYLNGDQRQGKFGPLGALERISSVSGGSITAATLGLAWSDLKVDQAGVNQRFKTLVSDPIQQFAATTVVSKLGIIISAILPGSMAKTMERAFAQSLFADKTLQHLPQHPRFIINATNLQSGALWRFSKDYNWDWRVGKIEHPTDRMALVVSASAAFPPFLSPVRLKYKSSDYVPDTGHDLQEPPFTTRPMLSDGGVYDNLGVESIWKNFKTVLVSDAGSAFKPQAKVATTWGRQSYRVLSTIDNQVRSLRKRNIVASHISQERYGAYWSIGGNIANYSAANKLPCPYAHTQQLARLETNLTEKDVTTQRRLINWGYAICDASIRSLVEDGLVAPTDFPFPDEAVG